MLPIYPIINLARDARVDDLFVDRLLRLLRPRYIQLRQKEGNDADIAANALRIRERIVRSGIGARLVVNDRPDIAARCGAPAVHVGDTDMGPAAVRRRYPDLRVGWSAHTLDDIAAANDLDLVYVGFGPVFDTATKPTGRPAVLPLCAKALELSRHPVVFIGGITPDNIAQLPASELAQAALIGALADLLEREERHA